MQDLLWKKFIDVFGLHQNYKKLNQIRLFWQYVYFFQLSIFILKQKKALNILVLVFCFELFSRRGTKTIK